ncbi:helicase protein [Oesophagostomum dentatum]|uniref:RNA helicase n=1 Tax=Oesophagostomum dentatum TaxID=61180 RepID=A0A0B1SYD7_OESDE|nr:helicase protein [Oesophagostomum dentatum]
MGYQRLLPLQIHSVNVLASGIGINFHYWAEKDMIIFFSYSQTCVSPLAIEQRKPRCPLVLILGETNNHMEQAYKIACKIAPHSPIDKTSYTNVGIFGLYSGGQGMRLLKSLRTIQYEIVVATCPGALKALQMKKLDLSHLKMLIIDEGEKIQDANCDFALDVKRIYSEIPKQCKVELIVAEFSNTFMPRDSNVLLSELEKQIFCGKMPVLINIPAPLGYVNQRILQLNGFKVEPVNSDFTLDDNRSTLQKLHNGEVQAVVATNKLPRGQDLPGVNHVIIYDMPENFNDYVYRDFTLDDNRSTLQKLHNGEVQAVVATNKLPRGQDLPGVNHVIIYDMPENFNDYVYRLIMTW